ncbi:MAG: hypothetical protein U1F34_07095 [Gammaproteobacteria bacterium]
MSGALFVEDQANLSGQGSILLDSTLSTELGGNIEVGIGGSLALSTLRAAI